MIQLDTGVLTRLCQKDHRDHQVASACVQLLHSRNEEFAIVPQNLYEFWTVATRPRAAAEGLGLSSAQAADQVGRFVTMFVLQFSDEQQLYDEWLRLAANHDCAGKAAHDARIVAAMNLHGAMQLLTFNPKDFQRYPITVLDPAEVVERQPRA